MASPLTLERRGGVAVLTLNRPRSRNALDLAMRQDLAAAIADLHRDRSLRALVLTGAGGHFCAGGDLAALKARSPGALAARDRIRDTHPWVHGLLTLERPVLAAVEGAAYGGGFNLALAADRVLAAPSARFCQVFGRIGMVPDLAGMALLPRSIGLARARRAILSGEVFTAKDGLALGFVHRIVDPSDLLERAITEADAFSATEAEDFGHAKRAIWLGKAAAHRPGPSID